MTEVYVDPADFPQVWQKPNFEDLLACLRQLRTKPQVWKSAALKENAECASRNNARSRREITSYLSSIVGNGLLWIDDDDQKEIIWEEASRCLSERCGRAGMGEMIRTWPFTSRDNPFELIIREPPIIGDSIGHKTWGSSYRMAHLLDDISADSLSHLFGIQTPKPKILELGSGTGLLGMAAAAMWSSEVVLSDLPSILSNLDFNIGQNQATIQSLGGSVSSAAALTWGSENGNDTRFDVRNQFDIILAADGIYDDDHPSLLASAIHQHLRRTLSSRALIITPIRDQITQKLISQFKSNMTHGDLPLLLLEEHRVNGQDEWGQDGENQEVECWWAIFGRHSKDFRCTYEI